MVVRTVEVRVGLNRPSLGLSNSIALYFFQRIALARALTATSRPYQPPHSLTQPSTRLKIGKHSTLGQIFISYKHSPQDQNIVSYLAGFLRGRGHDVFLDVQMYIGTDWVAEIDRQLRASEFLIVLLSKESILSDMVRQEVKLAYELQQKHPDKRPKILPIRVDFEGALPYDLGAYLDRKQYTVWRNNNDFQRLSEQIVAAIDNDIPLPQRGSSRGKSSNATIMELANVTEQTGAPLPKADSRLVDSGTIRLDSRFYIRREADDELENQINQRGTTTIVKGMRQMGKSSLLARAWAEAKQHQNAIYLDMQLIEKTHYETLETLMNHIVDQFRRTLKIATRVNSWDKRGGITAFIEEMLSISDDTRVLVLFDEVDRVFKFPYRGDFFSILRAWHNKRAIEDRWLNINLVIAHSNEPRLWIDNLNTSPFNVGDSITLADFSCKQVVELNRRHGEILDPETEVKKLMKLVGGQPYLVRQAMYVMGKNKWQMAQLKAEALKEDGPFSDHLRRYLWYLHKHRDLKGALRKILNFGRCDNEDDFQRLRALGLLEGENRMSVQLRCDLYKKYLQKHL